jgi:hypothetical protein
MNASVKSEESLLQSSYGVELDLPKLCDVD